MLKKCEELTDEFDAVSEDGQQFRLLVYTTMLDASSMSTTPNAAPIEGSMRICTSDGQHCNRIDDDTFEIVGLDLQVKRA